MRDNLSLCEIKPGDECVLECLSIEWFQGDKPATPGTYNVIEPSVPWKRTKQGDEITRSAVLPTGCDPWTDAEDAWNAN